MTSILNFNRSQDNYKFFGSEFRRSDGVNSLKLSSDDNTYIEISNNGVNINSSNLTLNNAPIATGSASSIEAGTDASFNNLDVSGILNLTANNTATIRGPSNIKIDPAAHGNNTGTLTIAGNLTVQGTTTTINSTIVDISDKTLKIASQATSTSTANNAGIEIGNNSGNPFASIVYKETGNKLVSDVSFEASSFIGDISGNAATATKLETTRTIGGIPFNGTTNIDLSGVNSIGNQDTTGNAATATKLATDISINGVSFNGGANIANVPVSYNSFALKKSGFSDLSGTTTGWQDATGYVLNKTLLSSNSLVKMEFKVNFISSPEADQTLSFQVLKSTDGGNNYNGTAVFTDENIGSNMGVTIRSVYNGTYIDTPGSTNVYYKLQFKREGTDIDTSFGIIGNNSGDYIYLQELYEP